MKRLVSTLAPAVLLLAAALPPAAAVAPEPAASAFTQQLASLINDYRLGQGLEPLALADNLALLAGEHSLRMTEVRQLSHEGFRERSQRTRSRVCVENVAWNYRTPEALLEGWQRSPSHHRNLLEPKVSRMGIALSTRYVTFFACS